MKGAKTKAQWPAMCHAKGWDNAVITCEQCKIYGTDLMIDCTSSVVGLVWKFDNYTRADILL